MPTFSTSHSPPHCLAIGVVLLLVLASLRFVLLIQSFVSTYYGLISYHFRSFLVFLLQNIRLNSYFVCIKTLYSRSRSPVNLLHFWFDKTARSQRFWIFPYHSIYPTLYLPIPSETRSFPLVFTSFWPLHLPRRFTSPVVIGLDRTRTLFRL